MKSFKNFFSTIVLASLAFVISGAQTFGVEEEAKEVLIYIAMQGGTPKEQEAIMEHIAAGSTAQYEGVLLASSPVMKVFNIGDYDPNDTYFIKYSDEEGEDYYSSFDFQPEDIGAASGKGETDWAPSGRKLRIIRDIDVGEKGKSGKPRVLVTVVLGLPGWEPTKEFL